MDRLQARGDTEVSISLTRSDELCNHLVADCADPDQVEQVTQTSLNGSTTGWTCSLQVAA